MNRSNIISLRFFAKIFAALCVSFGSCYLIMQCRYLLYTLLFAEIKMESLKKTLSPLMLWGLGVGYVISGMYFGWNPGLKEGGPIGMLLKNPRDLCIVFLDDCLQGLYLRDQAAYHQDPRHHDSRICCQRVRSFNLIDPFLQNFALRPAILSIELFNSE